MPRKKYTRSRPAIPAVVSREVRLEARHACLVCLQRVSLHLHHIDDNRENNIPRNLVYICSNCHGMVHDGKISAQDLIEYKRKAKESDAELIKLKEQVDQLSNGSLISVSTDFGQLQIKYQKSLAEYADKLIFYQCFIYLITEFYIDSRGDAARAIVRDSMSISEQEELTVINHLRDLHIINIVGGLITLKDNSDAIVALNELIDTGKLNIDKLMEKFSNL